MSFKTRSLLFASLMATFLIAGSESVSAYSGTGYYNGQTVCTTNYDEDRFCTGTTISSAKNDVVYGGITGSTTKAGFKSWLSSVSGTPGGRFIMDTMGGKGITLANLNVRIDDPNVTFSTVTGLPRDYGSISFRGKSSTGSWDYFFNSVYVPSSRALILMRYKGTIVYVIEIKCANPIGGLPGLPPPPPPPPPAPAASCTSLTLSISNRIDVELSSVAAVSNGATISSHVFTLYNSPSGSLIASRTVTTTGTTASPTMTVSTPGNYLARVTIKTSLGDRTSASCEKSFTILPPPIVYTLTPTANVTTTDSAVGQTVTVQYSVRNVQTDGTQSNSTGWGVREVTIPPGVAMPAAFNNYKDGSNGCGYYTAFGSGIACTQLLTGGASGTAQNQIFAPNSTTALNASMVSSSPPSFNQITVSGAPGTRICRVLFVTPRDASGDNSRSRDSALSCVLVAASPYVALVGAPAWAGGGVTAPFNGPAGFSGTSNGGIGSFGEYGLFATGLIKGFGSAGQVWNTLASSGMHPGTRLTFANAAPSYGSFTSSHQITDISGRCTGPIIPNITLAGKTYYKGESEIVCANTVTITGDIKYDTTGVASFAEVPQVTVIADTILVKGAVTQIAGWYYAKTRFKTCEEGPTSFASSVAITTTGACSKQLVINGSISVARQAPNSLVLNRSYGGAVPGQPSEIIRMRPEGFLTQFENDSISSNMLLTTVQEIELPARY